MGALLASSLIIIPAATARQLTDKIFTLPPGFLGVEPALGHGRISPHALVLKSSTWADNRHLLRLVVWFESPQEGEVEPKA